MATVSKVNEIMLQEPNSLHKEVWTTQHRIRCKNSACFCHCII